MTDPGNNSTLKAGPEAITSGNSAMNSIRSDSKPDVTSVHNVLVRDILADEIEVMENFQGAVGTINPGNLTELVMDASGRVLGEGGLPVPLLHQYDRYPALAAQWAVKRMAQFEL